uniref:Uncharacterized protein n=1 Tax=Romanomermis culicivorax TaxID=13658 RepID=A0A915JMK7_ROMCU
MIRMTSYFIVNLFENEIAMLKTLIFVTLHFTLALCQHSHSHGHAKDRTSHPSKEANHCKSRFIRQKWIFCFYEQSYIQNMGSTILISAAPFFILFFIPSASANSPFLKVLLGFASGGLLGDALLHLIPHALEANKENSLDNHSDHHGHSHEGHGHSHGPGHEHNMAVGFYVLMGITIFLIIDKFVRLVNSGGHGHTHSHGGKFSSFKSDATTAKKKSSHKHHNSDKDEYSSENEEIDAPKTRSNAENMELRQRKKTSSTSRSPKKEKARVEKESKTSREKVADRSSNDDSHQQTATMETHAEHQEGVKVTAYLNLAADFTHNLTDGLAIGASYMAGNVVGLITTATVLVHEVPHEIGDFAILIQSGCSRKNAILLQLLTALGALLGCCISLCTSDPEGVAMAAASSWVLPFTAGGFVYIATVSIIPVLLESQGVWQSVKEIVAMLIGIFMMILVAKLE